MRDVLILCPQARDRNAVRAAGLHERYDVHFVGADLDTFAGFDPAAFLDECMALPADGVIGTKDRSALLAALLAARRGLPGPSPAALLACQHKLQSRSLQRSVVAGAIPAFTHLNGAPGFLPPFPPPWFAKPVVGRLSQGVRRIDRAADLVSLSDSAPYTSAYADIAELAGMPRRAVSGFVVEELASGMEVTLEGYVYAGDVRVIGITDSVKYPGTNSFERFEYPSALSEERRRELAGLTEKVLPALGFDGGFFNVEFLVPDEGPATLVEVNGRIASQFAPLIQAVHGRSTYDALAALACGEDPKWSVSSAQRVAISYVLRTFDDAFVEAVPDPEEGLEVLVRPGLRLSQQGLNDMESYRLAIVYAAGETRQEALERCLERAASLDFRLQRAPAPLRSA